MIIKWNADKYLFSVNMKSDLMGKTCGLCGNFNDDQDDDWTMGSATCETSDDFKTGVTVSDVVGFLHELANEMII